MVPLASIFHLKTLSKRVQLAITIKPAMKTYRRPLEKVSCSWVGTGSGFLSTLNESMNKDRIHIDIRIEGRFSCWIRLTWGALININYNYHLIIIIYTLWIPWFALDTCTLLTLHNCLSTKERNKGKQKEKKTNKHFWFCNFFVYFVLTTVCNAFVSVK